MTSNRPASVVVVALATLALAACGQSGARSPGALVDGITRSVYAADYDGTTSYMDAATKAQVTRAEIGDLSDRMHALGAYQGAAEKQADPDRGVYEYDLKFASGHMTGKDPARPEREGRRVSRLSGVGPGADGSADGLTARSPAVSACRRSWRSAAARGSRASC